MGKINVTLTFLMSCQNSEQLDNLGCSRERHCGRERTRKQILCWYKVRATTGRPLVFISETQDHASFDVDERLNLKGKNQFEILAA